jgi:hypothetical protein
MHEAGFCHLDTKHRKYFVPGRMFSLILNGAVTKIVDEIRERTVSYSPQDSHTAEIQADMLLLAVRLLEIFGSVKPPTQLERSMSRDEIMAAITEVESAAVRVILLSIFEQPRAQNE